MPAALWIDVDDLLVYGLHATRPTGIQRVAFELCMALQAELGPLGRVHFVRHNHRTQSFTAVPWDEVKRLIDRLTQPGRPIAPAAFPQAAPATKRQAPAIAQPVANNNRRHRRRMHRAAAERIMRFLPHGYGIRLANCARCQYWALAAFADLARFALRDATKRLRRRWRGPIEDTPAETNVAQDSFFSQTVQPGDVLLILGAPDKRPHFPILARQHQATYGLRFALLYYDIIPIRHPEWFDRDHGRTFKAWHTLMLPALDHIFAISHATADDVTRHAAACRIRLRSAVRVVPMGTGFSSQTADHTEPETDRLPQAGSYVLFVSTVEPRKNHALLFRVWRRMLQEMPREQVPTLVFAGAMGWLARDFAMQMVNSDYLHGKLCHLQGLSDPELAALYRGALFTLYPSFYEGWGLPVSESFAFGKPCIVANRSSLPEAGGVLARYFDPDNGDDAYRVIRATIEDRPGLAEWEATVQRDFRSVSWAEAAHQIATDLGAIQSADHPG